MRGIALFIFVLLRLEGIDSFASPGVWRGSRRGRIHALLPTSEEQEYGYTTIDVKPCESDDFVRISNEKEFLDLREERVISQEEAGCEAKATPFPKLPGSTALKAFLNEPFVELAFCVLVLLSSLLVAIDTLEGLDPAVNSALVISQNVISDIFAIEFALRWYACFELGFGYFLIPLVVVDLIVVVLPLTMPLLRSWGEFVPQWLTSKGGLVNLRLLRVLRLQRVLVDQNTFSRFERGLGLDPTDVRPYQLQLARVVLSLFTLLSVASGLIYSTEHLVNPDIPDYFTALYFGLTTLTTVGFGDITPVTTAGKLVVSGSILAGVAIIPAQAASLVEAFLDAQRQQSNALKICL